MSKDMSPGEYKIYRAKQKAEHYRKNREAILKRQRERYQQRQAIKAGIEKVRRDQQAAETRRARFEQARHLAGKDPINSWPAP